MKNLRLLLLVSLWTSLSHASQTVGYSDNPCLATPAAPTLFKSQNGADSRIYNVYVNTKYTLTCQDGATYVENASGLVYYTKWAGSNVVGASPSPWMLSGEPTSVSYASNQFVFKGYSNLSPYNAYTRNVADPNYPSVGLQAFSRPSSSGTSTTEIWNTRQEVRNGLLKMPTYDPSLLTTQILFNNIQPHNTLPPMFPFNLTSEDASTLAPRAFMKVTFTSMPHYFAMVYLLPGQGDRNYFDKPVVVCDAFDPSNKRRALDIYSKPRYSRLFSLTSPTSPRAQGNDMFFIDFAQGGGNLQLNAALVLKFTQWLSSQTTAKVYIGGPSMGGQVVRLALLYSLPENNVLGQDLAKGIKGFMAIDSPNQGASIGGSIQKAVHSLSVDNGLNFAVGFNNFLPLDEQENSAIDQWFQLSQPAAHQMLFEHYYPEINGTDTEGHDQFYAFVKSLGQASSLGDPRGYRKDIPSVAIAYSNFHVPHAGLNIDSYHEVGKIEVVANGATLASRTFNAGGPPGHAARQDLVPGSAGSWYYSLYSRKPPTFLKPHTQNGEIFKGTFITLASALDLENFDVLAPPTTDARSLARYSPFRAVYYMASPYNGYSTTQTADTKRYEHLIFDAQLMEAISKGLETLKKGPAAVSPAITSLLQD